MKYVVEALKFTGNDREALAFCPGARDPQDTKPNLIVPTCAGEALCLIGDYIVKGLRGDYLVISGPTFEAFAKGGL